MLTCGTYALALGGLLSAAASLAHLACIALGAPVYRAMGAGERMAQAAERGSWRPALVTLAVAAVLGVWALYVFSGAGLAPRLPLLRWALLAITAVYLCRALAFPLLKPRFPDNSATFWWVSSGVCFVIGSVHLCGLVALWPNL